MVPSKLYSSMRQRVQLNVRKKKTKHRKNSQKQYYSGKKKRHTLKTQVVVNKQNAKILALDFSNGKKHDFRLFKESKIRTAPHTTVLADTGYLGIQKIIGNSHIPHKRSKKNPLTKKQKRENHELSSKRVLCENVIGSVKRFRILSERYRNRRKRFGLRFNLIAGIHNFELV
jgi:hypothetical protein